MKTIFVSLLLLTAFASIPLAAYYFSYPPEYSFKSFWDWIMLMYNGTFSDDRFIFWFLSLAPVCCLIGLFTSLYSRQTALAELHSSLNLKSVDFLEGRIDFRFNQPQYNFSSGYDGIEELKMSIDTEVVHTKNSHYIAISQVVLNFTVLNGKTFKIANTGGVNPMKYVYNILDYTKYIPNFSYYINGPDDQYEEKIKNYLEKGFKSTFASKQRSNMKLFSIFLFILSLFLLYIFTWMIDDMWDPFLFIILIFPSAMFFWSIILDIIIIKDELFEKNFSKRGINER